MEVCIELASSYTHLAGLYALVLTATGTAAPSLPKNSPAAARHGVPLGYGDIPTFFFPDHTQLPSKFTLSYYEL
jgi:hypothetical protein